MQRLDKILSEAGVAPRKELRTMIRAGRVAVDGVVAQSPEQKADADCADIRVDGAPIRAARPTVILLYKPAGFVTATEDKRERTVMELLPEPYRKLGLIPVGRLDKETEGLLLLTNDGELAHRIISPKNQVEKVYDATHAGQAGPEDVAAFAAGLTLRDGTVCRAAKLEPLGPGKSRVCVQEGKYHQVRRMLAARGLHVRYLLRVGEGGLRLDGLLPGQCRELTPEECAGLLD